MRQMTRANVWFPEIFNDFFYNTWTPKVNNVTAPATNVTESEHEYTVELATPGMSKEDFNIRIDNENELVINMEKKASTQEENKEEQGRTRYLRREFAYSKYTQTLILPDDVDKKQIAAKVENGVLYVTLPKVVEANEPKVAQQITVS